MWSARTTCFEDMMMRAEKHSETDPVICDLIAFARMTGTLGLARYEKPVRLRIDEALQRAASELVDELRSGHAGLSGEVEGIQSLIDLIDEDVLFNSA